MRSASLCFACVTVVACATTPAAPPPPDDLPQVGTSSLTAGAASSLTPTPDLTDAVLIDVEPREIPELVRRSDARATLVCVWATWCAPCKRELPAVLRLSRELRSRGLATVLIGTDAPDDRLRALDFLREQGVDFPTYFRTGDEDAFIAALSPEWSGGMPVSMIFDPKGGLRFIKEGEASYESLKAAVELAIP